jgi:hypothetical protein
LTESRTQDTTHSDPFDELRITHHEKLKPVVVRHVKKCSTRESINPTVLKIPDFSTKDFKKNSARPDIVLPKIQKEIVFTPRNLTHSSSITGNRQLFDKRVNFKEIGRAKIDAGRMMKNPSITEKILEVSFGN